MNALQRIRQAVHEETYRISSHANDEMADDFFDAADVEKILLTGKISKKFTLDPRGTRYEVCGKTTDKRNGCVVCRFLSSGTLLIITAYSI